ncbi:hypothetical protein B0H67DRAFT_649311 [Lasiosphaeris hirsuta]|uniref:Uncharacterized protein n=1 Tax=Lasiosphaeris hirsuta TaxID=260670 RepID=A0AA40DKS9_9PEZI|nr:hypothetical protein B0H67DRAFT_649311 [Lasiosphaeris hirsuta]
MCRRIPVATRCTLCLREELTRTETIECGYWRDGLRAPTEDGGRAEFTRECTAPPSSRRRRRPGRVRVLISPYQCYHCMYTSVEIIRREWALAAAQDSVAKQESAVTKPAASASEIPDVDMTSSERIVGFSPQLNCAVPALSDCPATPPNFSRAHQAHWRRATAEFAHETEQLRDLRLFREM